MMDDLLKQMEIKIYATLALWSEIVGYISILT